jgi:2-polyprenyl-3-methyl-5-hydroxy-6-metoxy-1,4-benzoquinol methylase
MPPSAKARLRTAAGAARNQTQFLLGQVGITHSSDRLIRDASRYWSGERNNRWQNDSHWHGGSKFADTDRWAAMGQEHLQLFQRLRRTVDEPAPLNRIIDWGCGGGANAASFAPLAKEFIGVDVATESVEESARRVSQACSTPFIKVVADMAYPEEAAKHIPRPCDLFLCLYVLELVPTQAYGLRIMRIAYDLLGPGGQAFVQIKYATGSWRTRSRRRSYRSAVAGITYRIDEFWTAMAGIGFRPQVVALVPKNDLDERYAYFLLQRGSHSHPNPGTEAVS